MGVCPVPDDAGRRYSFWSLVHFAAAFRVPGNGFAQSRGMLRAQIYLVILAVKVKGDGLHIGNGAVQIVGSDEYHLRVPSSLGNAKIGTMHHSTCLTICLRSYC